MDKHPSSQRYAVKRKVSEIWKRKTTGEEKENEKTIESGKKRLFLCLYRDCDEQNNDNTVLYDLDPAINNNKIGTLKAICRLTISEIGKACGAAALASKIYLLGGYRNGQPISEVVCFDTTSTTTKRMPDMLGSRCRPGTVSTHGKIYVFGSASGDLPHPWAESFDPDSNCWAPLPAPPDQVGQLVTSWLFTVALVSNGDKIILRIKTTMSCFDVNTKTWTLLSNSPLYDFRFCSTPASFDDLLFTFGSAQVYVYDLTRDKWLNQPVQGLEIKPLYCPTSDPGVLHEGEVSHIGGRTYSVALLDHMPSGQICVRCIRFQLTRVDNSKGQAIRFIAEVDCRSTYHLANGDLYWLTVSPCNSFFIGIFQKKDLKII